MISADKLRQEVRDIYPDGVDCHREYEVSDDGVVFEAFRDGTITVDKLLDHIDLKLSWYVPSIEAVEFFMFIQLVLGESPENKNSKPQYFLIDSIFKNPNVEPFFLARGIDMDDYPAETVVLCSREFSKALTLDTRIATPIGYREMRALKDGDMVYDRDGKETKILKKSGLFFNNTYKITLDDGRTLTTSYNHDNIVWRRHNQRIKGTNKMIAGLKESVKTTEDLYNNGDFLYNRTITNKQRKGYECKWYIPRMNKPVEFPSCNPKLDPYTVGVILGDGRVSITGYPTITTHKDDLQNLVDNVPYKFGKMQYKKEDENVRTFGLLGIGSIVKEYLGVTNSYNKRVPEDLMTGSVAERLSVLQGLMDTDGTVNKKGSTSFTTTSTGLAEDVKQLVYTLGGTATISERITESPFGKAWTVNIGINLGIFRLPRKKARETYAPARDMVGIIDIELIDSEPTQCISVDSPTKSFILENGVVTHNSVLTTFLILYMAHKGEFATYGKINYGLYVSDSMRNGVKKMMGRLKAIYYESEFLQNEFEEASFTQEECVLIRHPRTKKEIALYEEYVGRQKKPKEQVPGRMKRTFKVDGLGAATSSRGASNALTRPQFVFIDDVVANEVDATSETILASIESTIEADIRGGLSGSGYFMVVIGTPYNKKDPVYRRVESGLMLPVVFPRAAAMPLDGMQSKEFESVWPDRHTFKKCRMEYRGAKKAEEDGEGFKMKKLLQEHYLRITNSEDRLVTDDMLDRMWFSLKSLDTHLDGFNLVMTTDFTASNELKGDFSVGYMWAVTNNAEWYLVDMFCKRMTIAQQEIATVGMVQKWIARTGKYVEVGVEIDGQQRINVHNLNKIKLEKRIWFNFAKQIGGSPSQVGISRRRAGGDKHQQFVRVHGIFQENKIFIPEEWKGTPDMNELLDELKYITYDNITSKHDDALDGISMIGTLNVVYPSVAAGRKEGRKEDNIGFDPFFDNDNDSNKRVSASAGYV